MLEAISNIPRLPMLHNKIDMFSCRSNNVIYGSIAITVVALLSIEVAVVILLLGAQVIAELERKPGESAREPPAGCQT